MYQDLFRLIYPSICINCNQTLISGENYLCTPCKTELPLTNDSFTTENDLLEKFTFNSSVKGAASFLFFYQKGIAQKLLHRLKYRGQKEVGKMLGTYFSDQISGLDIDFILPVPIHIRKRRKRGYNQSTEIAKGISHKLGIKIKEDIIYREHYSSTQTRKSKVERWQGMKNVYGEASEYVEGRNILVLDDIITTGATIGMLCDRLAERRVQGIYIASIARGQ